MADYFNRLVHFYHEIDRRELFEIVSQRLGEVRLVLDEILQWIKEQSGIYRQSITTWAKIATPCNILSRINAKTTKILLLNPAPPSIEP